MLCPGLLTEGVIHYVRWQTRPLLLLLLTVAPALVHGQDAAQVAGAESPEASGLSSDSAGQVREDGAGKSGLVGDGGAAQTGGDPAQSANGAPKDGGQSGGSGGANVPQTPPEPGAPARQHWLDRTHQGIYDALWHTAMRVDRWFGSQESEKQYQTVYGSIAPAILYDQYYHLTTPVRFNINLPLPQLNERFHAFIGRVDPNEYISEREEPSGAFRRQYGPITEDQTLFGLSYHEPEKQGGYFDAGAGMRIALPLDPYIKGSYVYERGASERGLMGLRQTLFWDARDGFGVTSRADLERIYSMRWLLRWTGSVSVTQRSLGVIVWSAVDAMRGFADRKAVALEIETDGQTDAPVPLHNYGAKFAYRQGILRRWLIMELRTSVSWPKDYPVQHRSRSFGVGIGFEMLFGTDEFLARPVTF